MTIDKIAPSDSLRELRVGISVSESDDLSRLGLSSTHAEQAVGELARAVLVAGGKLVYGGHIKPSGFTQYLMHEVHRYGRDDESSLTLCLAAPEHLKLSCSELDKLDRALGVKGRVICLDSEGVEIEDILKTKPHDPASFSQSDAPHAYSSLRRYLSTATDARVLVGGKLSGFVGSMPGIIEEAITAVKARCPLYVSAGFGGAAALVAKRLHLEDLKWAPDNFPEYLDDKRIARGLELLDDAVASSGWKAASCGLDGKAIKQLAVTHRASDIASLVVRGLTRLHH
ncbi:MAG: hypothetical protein OXE79_05200 [Acidimicrobiaceae bacterium]|nr:hypothetical protein [Acidimicrobiaceae bacterium]MCY4281074.1 hypothetical protein [Acidimicrobiaceae bacterium]